MIVPSRRIESIRSLVGARIAKIFGTGVGRKLMLEMRTAWAHEFSPRENVVMHFLGDTVTDGFAVTYAGQSRNSVVAGFSIAGDIIKNLSLFADVDTELSSSQQSWTASGGMRYSW